VFAQLVHQGFFTRDDSSLRSAQQFIPGETDQVYSCLQSFLNGNFVRQAPAGSIQKGSAALVKEQWYSRGFCQNGEFFKIWFRSEAHNLKIGMVREHQQLRAFFQRLLIIPEMDPICRSDFHQTRAGFAQHIWNAKAAADFYQL